MDKYFTPDIEDIRVGYECEHRQNLLANWIKVIVADYHFKTKIPSGYFPIGIFNISEYLKQYNWIRVPYLTKEQVEAEGWEKVQEFEHCHDEIESNWYMFNKQNKYQIRWWGQPDYIEIYNIDLVKNKKSCIQDKDEYCIYQGQCKDINTFRYICKLLGI